MHNCSYVYQSVCVGVDHTVQNELFQEDASHTMLLCGVIEWSTVKHEFCFFDEQSLQQLGTWDLEGKIHYISIFKKLYFSFLWYGFLPKHSFP